MKRKRPLFAIFVILALATPFGAANGAETLRVLTRDTSAIGGPAQRHGESFERLTGTRVMVTQLPFRELYKRIMLGFVIGQMDFDVLLIPSAWLPDFAPYLTPVPAWLLDHPATADIHPVYRQAQMRWQNQWKALAIDGDLHLGAYRRDLFADPTTRAAFELRYGRPLRVPRTWSDYRDIAAFFSGRLAPDGTRLAGTLEAYALGGQRIWYLFSHAAAYVNHPDQPGAMFFDPVSMKPTIDNPAWVRALEDYVALRQFGPEDAAALDSEGVRERFADGQAAMNIDWADTGVLAGDPERSRIAGSVGFFVLPGSDEAWNPLTGEWDCLPGVRSVSFLAFGGWIAVVPKASENPEKAWEYVAWYASPEHSARDLLDGTSGINPYRRSHLRDSVPWHRLLGKRQADDYLSVLRDSLEKPDPARDLRLPGYRAYIAALERQLDRVLAGEATARDGLQATARVWETLTDRLGRASQRRHYRQAMGLPGELP